MDELERSSQPLPVAVIGAGFGGVAAAWAARRAGVDVTLIHATAGASALYSGAVDGIPAEPEALALAMRLGLAISSTPRALATREGVVRSATGRDRSLLDLEMLAGRRIAVADFGRDDSDARLLAASFAASSWARRTRTQFVAVRVPALASGAERRIAPFDFARCFDDAARLTQLAEALRTADPQAAAWLTGPWLGVQSEAALELAAQLSRPVGETTSAPGGVAGARFELRRDELLREMGVAVRAARATALEPSAGGVSVVLSDATRIEARSVVLALGGVVAGGIELTQDSSSGRLRVQLSLQSPAELKLGTEFLDGGSSAWGPSFQRVGLSALERLGVHVDETGRVGPRTKIFACGDVIAGRPRTVLDALNSGLAAGRSAAVSNDAASAPDLVREQQA